MALYWPVAEAPEVSLSLTVWLWADAGILIANKLYYHVCIQSISTMDTIKTHHSQLTFLDLFSHLPCSCSAQSSQLRLTPLQALQDVSTIMLLLAQWLNAHCYTTMDVIVHNYPHCLNKWQGRTNTIAWLYTQTEVAWHTQCLKSTVDTCISTLTYFHHQETFEYA